MLVQNKVVGKSKKLVRLLDFVFSACEPLLTFLKDNFRLSWSAWTSNVWVKLYSGLNKNYARYSWFLFALIAKSFFSIFLIFIFSTYEFIFVIGVWSEHGIVLVWEVVYQVLVFKIWKIVLWMQRRIRYYKMLLHTREVRTL